MTEEIKTVTYQEGDRWVVQGLERNIDGRGKTVEIARDRFNYHVEVTANELGGLELVEPAPQRFWDMAAEQEARD